MNFSEQVKEKFQKVADLMKSSFADEVTEETTEEVATEETAESVETKFAEVTLMDGETVLSYDGELAEGTAIFIVDAESGEQLPAPEGTHELGGDMAGVSIVVDAEGMISEVIDAREEVVEEVEPEMMSSEKVDAMIEEKLSEVSTPLNAIVDGIESLIKENTTLKNELSELRNEFNEFKSTPSVEQEQETKFSRSEKMSAREKYLFNLRNNK